MKPNPLAPLATGRAGRTLTVATALFAATLGTTTSLTPAAFAQGTPDAARAAFDSIIARLDSIPVDDLPTGRLFNRGYLTGQRLDEYVAIARSGEGFVEADATSWLAHFRATQLSAGGVRFPAHVDDLADAVLGFRLDDPTVTVGVLYTEGALLTESQVEAELAAVRGGRWPPRRNGYERFPVFAGAVMSPVTTGPEVTFEFPETFWHVGAPGNRVRVEVDLADGRGFRQVHQGTRLTTAYDASGEKAIAVRLRHGWRTYVSYAVLEVIGIDAAEPDWAFDIATSTPAITQAAGAVVSRAAPAPIAGRAELYLGCDGALDKPFILVEGFDPLNERNIAFAKDRAKTVQEQLNYSGYDVIYVDFTNGGADIRQNAEVVKAVIRQVNASKVGSHKIFVAGASMGGLISRYAIRTMERSGETHNVSHFLAYDSPFRGANVPVGYQEMLGFVDDSY